jgi:hypothetical protein
MVRHFAFSRAAHVESGPTPKASFVTQRRKIGFRQPQTVNNPGFCSSRFCFESEKASRSEGFTTLQSWRNFVPKIPCERKGSHAKLHFIAQTVDETGKSSNR